MKISQWRLWQSLYSGRKNRFRTHNVTVPGRMTGRLESPFPACSTGTIAPSSEVRRPVHGHFPKVTTRMEKESSGLAHEKRKVDSKQMVRPERDLNFDEIEQANFKAFKKCFGTKKGDTKYDARYDYDKNGVIDMVDWLGFGEELQKSCKEFKSAYGSCEGKSNYASKYDYDGNGVIDMLDWLEFGKNWTA